MSFVRARLLLQLKGSMHFNPIHLKSNSRGKGKTFDETFTSGWQMAGMHIFLAPPPSRPDWCISKRAEGRRWAWVNFCNQTNATSFWLIMLSSFFCSGQIETGSICAMHKFESLEHYGGMRNREKTRPIPFPAVFFLASRVVQVAWFPPNLKRT